MALSRGIAPSIWFKRSRSLDMSGMEAITTVEHLGEAAKRIADLGPRYVVVKGGAGLPGDQAVDVVFDGSELTEFRAPKVGQERVSGAGCVFAAAITAE